jgi:hypothetical protein
MQSDPIGNIKTFVLTQKAINRPYASCRKLLNSRYITVLFYRILSDLLAEGRYLSAFCKRNVIFSRAEAKGEN